MRKSRESSFNLVWMPAALLLATVACGGSSGCGGICGGDCDRIFIFSQTSGVSLDPNGYQVRVQGPFVNLTINMQNNDEVEFFVGDNEGTYELTLEDVAANCSVEENPQSVDVAGCDAEVGVTFVIVCE